MASHTGNTAPRGRVLLFTGDGKGKTTAALGLVLRATGHSMAAKMISFIKSPERVSGEMLAAEKMKSFSIAAAGRGFTWESKDVALDRASAADGWRDAKHLLADANLDLLVLDEITYPIELGWIDEAEVISSIAHRAAHHVVMTGRRASEALVELADTATEMRELKHGFSSGTPAQKGIEF